MRTISSIARAMFAILNARHPAKNKGVTIRTPMASASHQIRHAEVKPDHAGMWVTSSAVDPIEAATIGGTAAPSTTSTMTCCIFCKES